jgi:phage I-like protein
MSHCGTMNGILAMNAGGSARHECGVIGTILEGETQAPEWIELIPAGAFEGRDGRGPYRLDDPAAVIAATAALKMEAGLPIDYDHATDFAAPEGRPAPAAGWIREFAARQGALWGRVEWTRPGAEAVATHEYRYISPVFEHAKDGSVIRVLRAALTNNPNLYLTAIAARVAREQRETADEAADDGGANAMASDNLSTTLCALLGLEEDASSDEIVAEVERLMDATAKDSEASQIARRAAQATDPAQYVPIAEFERTLSELNQVRAKHARERAEHRVESAMKAGKIAPAQREWAIGYCESDGEAFDNFVKRQPSLIAGLSRPASGDARSVDSEANRGPHTRVVLTRTEAAVCARLGIKGEEYAASRGARGERYLEDHRG